MEKLTNIEIMLIEECLDNEINELETLLKCPGMAKYLRKHREDKLLALKEIKRKLIR